jgi:uroporphyrinogen-III synthase
MAEGRLAGVGVLVTRPPEAAGDLVNAIEAEGGSVVLFPAIEILPLDPAEVARERRRLREPDIALFVSANAVRYGLEHAGKGKIAAIGPATAAAIEAAGRIVDIRPASGFDSEHLLAEPALSDVDGAVVRILRGRHGRELIAESLTARGAKVEFLPVYDRRKPDYAPAVVADLEASWRAGDVDVVTVMSIESLTNLVELLTAWCKARLALTPLVTPAARVLKEALALYPDMPVALAKGPGAVEMVHAIARHAPDKSR